MNTPKDLRLAVLIDADNIPYRIIKGILEEVAKYGTPTFKRIYGDWTNPHLTGWKTALLKNAISPIQQYSYTSGKNSTDSAMIIDAMDILYTGRVDGFCLITSDSDFTRLATRLREAGMKVFGLGEKKTPEAFRASCDKFIYIEILAPNVTPSADTKHKVAKTRKEAISKIDSNLISLIASGVNDIADENGWAYLGELGNHLIKKQPDFDARNYGFEKLMPLIKSLPDFEIDERETGKRNIKLVYVRNKE